MMNSQNNKEELPEEQEQSKPKMRPQENLTYSEKLMLGDGPDPDILEILLDRLLRRKKNEDTV